MLKSAFLYDNVLARSCHQLQAKTAGSQYNFITAAQPLTSVAAQELSSALPASVPLSCTYAVCRQTPSKHGMGWFQSGHTLHHKLLASGMQPSGSPLRGVRGTLRIYGTERKAYSCRTRRLLCRTGSIVGHNVDVKQPGCMPYRGEVQATREARPAALPTFGQPQHAMDGWMFTLGLSPKRLTWHTQRGTTTTVALCANTGTGAP